MRARWREFCAWPTPSWSRARSGRAVTTSVVVERDGFRQKVKVICSGNTVEFRCSRQEAESAKALLTDLMLGRHPAQLSAAVATTPAPLPLPAPRSAPDGLAEGLEKLANMRASGVLTDEEFSAAKSRILLQLT